MIGGIVQAQKPGWKPRDLARGSITASSSAMGPDLDHRTGKWSAFWPIALWRLRRAVTIKRGMFKSLQELQHVQAARKGQVVAAPTAVYVQLNVPLQNN